MAVSEWWFPRFASSRVPDLQPEIHCQDDDETKIDAEPTDAVTLPGGGHNFVNNFLMAGTLG